MDIIISFFKKCINSSFPSVAPSFFLKNLGGSELTFTFIELFYTICFSCRIEQALHKSMTRNELPVVEKNSIIYQEIVGAIDMHRKAFESVILINLIKENMFYYTISL